MTIVLTKRLQCDLELLLNGGFSPLKGFLNEEDYYSVLENMRLASGEIWTIPIVLPISENIYKVGETVNLVNEENLPIASLKIESIYKPDIEYEAEKVFGVYDDNHPYIKIMNNYRNHYYLGGKVNKINDIPHYDFVNIRLTPKQTKKYFKENNWETIIGFQTRNPMHRSHFELTKYALRKSNSEDPKLLLNPVVGITQECDIDYHTRVRCYEHLIKKYPKNTVKLSLLPLSMRMAGPREAVWHAIIRKNHGCTHFVVGRDHAGPSYNRKDGNKFLGPYDAQYLLNKFSNEIGINVILSKMDCICCTKRK